MSSKSLPYHWWYKMRGWLLLPLLAVMFGVRWGETEHDAVLPVGILIFAVGLWLRIWAQMHLQYRLRRKNHFVSTGPYRYVRNPVYVANTILLLGLCVLSEVLWLCPFVIVYCAVLYTLVVKHEECRLRRKYGEQYVLYCQHVPRWMPFSRPPENLPASSGWELLWPSVKVEFHNAFLLLLPLLKELISPR